MSLPRRPGWNARLSDMIDEARRTPYELGVHDCGLFAADAIQATTGADLALDLRGTYSTNFGAKKALKKLGFDSHVDMLASFLDEIHPSMAQTGDIAVIGEGNDRAMGVVVRDRIFVLKEKSLGTVDLLSAATAFRVGE